MSGSSSQKWLARRAKDPYVKKAQAQGMRSRATYKLEQIQQKDCLIKQGQCVVDIGSAPGGWSQIVAPWVGEQGRVVACDLLVMDPIPCVTFIQGDFNDAETIDAIVAACNGRRVDVVLSDMAPNASGVRQVDQWQAMDLCEQVLKFAQRQLKTGGALLIKVFHGDGFDDCLKQLRQCFKSVKVRKPDASQRQSREVYFLATGYKGESN